MIYTDLTERAMLLAYRAHAGQVDKAGMPYIFHPYHLAEQMTSEAEVCVALLHDVVEDSEVTIEEIASLFPAEVTEAVRLLTHGEHIPYLDYIRALRTNPLARTVKLADLAHNSDESRLRDTVAHEPALVAKRRTKYNAARAILLEEVHEPHSLSTNVFERSTPMNTLTLLVTYNTQPGMARAFVDAIAEAGLLDAIHAEEGCLRYDYYFPAHTEDEVLLVEAWESAELQAVHLQQPHMQQVAAIKADYVTDTTVQKFTTI